ncbi:hypothetical protein PGRAN_11969, partial [Listeria grandensis FSL F6-0971]
TGIEASEIKAKYSAFKEVVRSIGEEKSWVTNLRRPVAIQLIASCNS